MADIVFYDGMTGPEVREALNQLVELFEEAIASASGPQGWSPELAAEVDSARRVQRVVGWLGGSGVAPVDLGYVGPSGLVATAGEATDIRGPAGPANTLAIGTVDEGEVAASITGTAPNQTLNLTLPRGNQGYAAWMPIFSAVTDDDRIVLQVTDWFGGGDTKPTTGYYLGETGYEVDIAEAVNVRGPAGAGSGNVSTVGSVANNHLALFTDGTGTGIKSGGLATATGLSILTAADAAAVRTILNVVEFDGTWDDIDDKPIVIAAGDTAELARAAIGAGTSDFSGSWDDLTDKPLVIAAGDTMELARLAIGASDFSGDYADLENNPLAVYQLFSAEAAAARAMSNGHTIHTLGATTTIQGRVGCSKGNLAIFGANSTSATAVTTTDGVTLTNRTLPSSAIWYFAASGVDGYFIGSANSSTAMCKSNTAGTSFSAVTALPGTSRNISSMPGHRQHAALGDLWLVCASAANTVYRTVDAGANWTTESVGGTYTHMYAAGSVFLAWDGSGVYLTSPDGLTWSGRNWPNSVDPVAVYQVEPRKVLIVSGNGNVYETTDGINWTLIVDISTLWPTTTVIGAVMLGSVPFAFYLDVGTSAFLCATYHNGAWSMQQPVRSATGSLNFNTCYGAKVGSKFIMLPSAASYRAIVVDSANSAHTGLFEV